MSCSIVLFKLAQLNSEIKYILHSISRDTPRYTYPQIPDIEAWQSDLYHRLEAIFADFPVFGDEDDHLTKICQIRYHEIVMLLFRPTPRIRTPSKRSLLQCHSSAEATIRLWKELYDSDRMSYSWITIHSICLSGITLLYCIWMVPETAVAVKIDALTSTMRASSNILSAAGEHWTEARRSRNNLDDLTAATVRWLLDLHATQKTQNWSGPQAHSAASLPNNAAANTGGQPQGRTGGVHLPDLDFPVIGTYINGENLADFVGAPDPFASDFSLTMEGMFSEYQPLFDFSSQQDFGTSIFA